MSVRGNDNLSANVLMRIQRNGGVNKELYKVVMVVMVTVMTRYRDDEEQVERDRDRDAGFTIVLHSAHSTALRDGPIRQVRGQVQGCRCSTPWP